MKAHYEPADGLDASGEWVWHFRLEAHNLSKVSLLRQLVADAFEKKHWRSYATGMGRDTWRACEFDYFLIASDIAYRDIADVFVWKDHGRALAAATMSEDPAKRRSLEEASQAWRSPTPETLAQRAARLGWTTTNGISIRSAAPERARAYVRHGAVPKDQHTRQQRQRQVKARRAELDHLVETLVQRVGDATALRYVIDRLRMRLRGKPGRPSGDHQQWARDIAAFKGNTKALAKHWGVTEKTARKRQERQNTRLLSHRKAS